MDPKKSPSAQNQTKKPLRLAKESLKGLRVRSGTQTGAASFDSWICRLLSCANEGC